MPKPVLDPLRLIASARKALDIQAQALEALAAGLVADAQCPQSAALIKACSLMLECRGKIIVTGIGKSGHVAHKIAATLASTGSPAF
ncbi:MAG: D-arabinose 5-phosphate isomerase, partial [Betaproteobacteria bacterium]|nr:D-arabinose 5-phosphate isomerase [Betaproteobacteria bacterium]